MILSELKFYAKDLNLLIVEDQKDLNIELVELLEIFFKSVDFAFDGVEALEIYDPKVYDIVLSDVTMPRMDGIRLSTELRHINPEQPIVILSAHSELEFLIKLIDIGINQFVAKPFKNEELFYRLLKVCENIVYKKHYQKHFSSKDLDQKIKEKREQKKPTVATVTSVDSVQPVVSVQKVLKETKVIEENFDISTSTSTFLSHEVIDSNKFFKNLESDDLISQVLDDQIELLIEFNDDFSECVNKIYLNKLDEKVVNDIANILKNIQSILIFMDALRNLAGVIDNLANFLLQINFKNLKDEQIQKLKILEFIYDDISRFIQTVFIYKDSLDVHYLEDSLHSSCEQLKINILEQKLEEEELELF